MRTSIILFKAHVVLLLYLSTSANGFDYTVKTSGGLVRGFETEGYVAEKPVTLAAFYGIPYGESTAGKARWTQPVPKKPWSGVRDATKFGHACHGGNPVGSVKLTYSEDCLYANIWTPMDAVQNTGNNASKLPVLVWIHGGGFMFGTASDPVWWGNSWAARGFVFIGFDYRIGALGFFASKALPETNFGFKDQQLLLKWVQRNAAAFGGNPDDVTIMGQSAGAMSVLLHMTSPASVGLFHRGIANSPVGLHYRTLKESKAIMKSFANSLFCAVTDLDCLRSRPANLVVSAQLAMPYGFNALQDGFVNFLPWLPSVSGSHAGGLAGNPSHLFRTGNFTRVPLLLGTVKNETDAWIPDQINTSFSTNAIVRLVYGSANASRILRMYKDQPSPFRQLGAISTDSLFSCYARHVARLISDHAPGSVRLYQSLFSPSVDVSNTLHVCSHGALCHASDNTFVLSTANVTKGLVLKPKEHYLSELMIDAWTAFARGDDDADASLWPVYSAQQDQSLQWHFDGKTPARQVATGYHSEACDMWDDIGYQEQ